MVTRAADTPPRWVNFLIWLGKHSPSSFSCLSRSLGYPSGYGLFGVTNEESGQKYREGQRPQTGGCRAVVWLLFGRLCYSISTAFHLITVGSHERRLLHRQSASSFREAGSQLYRVLRLTIRRRNLGRYLSPLPSAGMDMSWRIQFVQTQTRRCSCPRRTPACASPCNAGV